MGSKSSLGKSAIINRYAESCYQLLLESSSKNKKNQKFEELVANFVNLIEKFYAVLEKNNLNLYFDSRIVSLNEKLKIVDAIKLEPLVHGFIRVLVKNKRYSLLPKILERIKHLFFLHQNIAEVELFSAGELTKENQKDAEKILEEKLGKKVKITYLIDKSILGGLVVKLGSRVLDLSLGGKLKRIQKNVKHILEIS